MKPDSVVLNDGQVIPCGMVVWSTGLSPQPLILNMDAQKDPRGQLLTDRNLNVLSDPSGHSYALGDCANIIDMPLPATAQVCPMPFESRLVCKCLLACMRHAVVGLRHRLATPRASARYAHE